MQSKTQHLVVTGLAPVQETVTGPPKPAPLLPISVSGRSTTPGADAAEEQNHYFRVDPNATLTFTIRSLDINNQLPENGSVTVEIFNPRLLDRASNDSLSNPEISPTVEYDVATATIEGGQAEVIFMADEKPASRRLVSDQPTHLGPDDDLVASTTLNAPMTSSIPNIPGPEGGGHLGPDDNPVANTTPNALMPSSVSNVPDAYSRLALITISSGEKAANAPAPVKYVFFYRLWANQSSQSVQKP